MAAIYLVIVTSVLPSFLLEESLSTTNKFAKSVTEVDLLFNLRKAFVIVIKVFGIFAGYPILRLVINIVLISLEIYLFR